MAILHRASLRPSKLELLAGWLPSQPWWRNDSVTDLRKVGSFRFDDPNGEVGVETLLVSAGRDVVQVPLTYRGAPLAGAEAAFVGAMDHSVLGQRWVYDACADPVYTAALSGILAGGGQQAEEFLDVDGTLVVVDRSVSLRAVRSQERPGTEEPDLRAADMLRTVVGSGEFDLVLFRVPDLSGRVEGPYAMVGTWQGQPTPVQFASGSHRS
jgi:hypothetical protein